MSTETYFVKLKKPTNKKQKQWLYDRVQFSNSLNWVVDQLETGTKATDISSKHVPFQLKSALKNEAIRQAKTKYKQYQKGEIGFPRFKETSPIYINNQNWETRQKVSNTGEIRWYIAFTSGLGKISIPVQETDFVRDYFKFLTKPNREFRGTIQLMKKKNEWYVAIPVEKSVPITNKHKKFQPNVSYTNIGVDLGLRHIAVLSEPLSNKRQFFSGKEIGYKRRHFKSLRRSLGKKKAQRAIERIHSKESRWMTDYNRKLAKDIVNFALGFEHPQIKLEQLDDIRNTCKSMKRSDKSIHSWSFYQLKQFIKERASKFNIPVVDINPYKTSQTCFHCKHAEKSNRSRDKFKCKQCGHQNHADLNAAKNISVA